MKKHKHIEFLKNLKINEYVPASAVALNLGVSSRTIRSTAKQLAPILEHNGASLTIKPHYGIKLEVFDYHLYDSYFTQELKKALDSLQPIDPSERVEHLISLFVASDKYILMDDLAAQLYVSRNSLTGDLKKVRQFLARFDLKIKHTPNYGLKLQGNEVNIRKCLWELELDNQTRCESDNQLIKQIVKVFDQNDYRCHGYALDEIAAYFRIAIARMSQGHYLGSNSFDNLATELALVDQIFALFSGKPNPLPKSEISFAAMIVKSRRNYPLESPYLFQDLDFESQNLIVRLLREISKYYQVNLFDNHDYDIELRNNLAVHLVSMRLRIENSIQIHNPILLEIKHYHTFSFMLARIACQYLESYFHQTVLQDEIGYIAIMIDLAIKKRTTYSNEKNILLVCNYGFGAQELLKFQFAQTFTRHVKQIVTTDSYNLPDDIADFDCIFSTVPHLQTNQPLMEISYELTDIQIDEIRKVLRTPIRTFSKPAFTPGFFYPHLNLKTKEEVIDFIVDQFVATKKIQPRSAREIKRREKATDSFFANASAILNPFQNSYQETVVSVCILERPIKWNDSKVQLIVTILNDQRLNRHLLRFFDVTAKLLLDSDKIQEIIAKRDFKTLLENYHQVDRSIPK